MSLNLAQLKKFVALPQDLWARETRPGSLRCGPRQGAQTRLLRFAPALWVTWILAAA